MREQRVILRIRPNEGYSARQIESRMTVGELKKMLDYYSDDAVIITHDENNPYGAAWGEALGVTEDYLEDDEDYDE